VGARDATLQTALPTVALDQLGRRRRMGRIWRQTESSDILLMPEGNGDMQTVFLKNFDCAHS
jgi:hypothetical protein